MERRGVPMLNHVLQHTLRGLCDSQWVYAVFWRILPRNYPPPKWENEGGVMDRSKSNKRNWILVWEDGFCDFPACSSAKEANTGNRYGNHAFNHADESIDTTMHPELFFKMSHEIYNYGEGLMGKVAADNSHKWVYREPLEHEISFLSLGMDLWIRIRALGKHNSKQAFRYGDGLQTDVINRIAVISVREGLIQLGSIKKVVEDLNFVITMQRKFNYLQSIPGVFVPHPSSPLPGVNRREGSPPADGACWPGTKDPALLVNGLFPRSNSDPYRIAGHHDKQFSNCVLGMKRPPEDEIALNFSSGRDFPFLPQGSNFNGSPLFDCRQTKRQPESPSPPKALNTGQTPNSISLLPSMSSLHNLLSKLPSVTALDSDAPSLPHHSSPSVLSLTSETTQLPQQQTLPLRQPINSPTTSTDTSIAGMPAEDPNASPRSSPPGSRIHHPCGTAGLAHLAGTSPEVEHDGNTIREVTSTCGSQQQQSHGSWDRNSSEQCSNTVAAPGLGDHHPMGPATKDKLTSFLDSFDQDSLTDLGLHDDLENSETYNSFLSEII